MAAPQTFATKAEAIGYLATLRTDQGRGVWVDPAVGQLPFGEYDVGTNVERNERIKCIVAVLPNRH